MGDTKLLRSLLINYNGSVNLLVELSQTDLLSTWSVILSNKNNLMAMIYCKPNTPIAITIVGLQNRIEGQEKGLNREIESRPIHFNLSV